MATYQRYDNFYFSIVDYVIFGSMIIISTLTGIYYGYVKKKRPEVAEGESDKSSTIDSNTIAEYLLGSRALRIFPVAMSLIASYVSGVTILGTPSEIYSFGTQYWMIIIAIALSSTVVALVYLPVFATLRVDSSYQYLEMRFSSSIRSIASIMFVLDEILFLPLIVYVPAIAFNQVTGINMHLISVIIVSACVIYTLLGGIKAVVHTDAWQILVMFLAVVVIAVLGSIIAGGPVEVFKHAYEGNRLIFFNMSASLYERATFWAVLVGGFSYWTSFNAVNQTMVQRYMSLPTLKNAQKSIAIFTIGIILFVSLCCYMGLLIYDYYRDCDPMSAGLVTHDDQLLPLYVMQTVGNLHGVPGLFIAGVFGAALSSLSVVLNSTALVILEDLVKGCLKLDLSETASYVLVKCSIVVLGCVAFALVFVVENLGGILSIATRLTAIAASATFGIFTLGMLVPWSNSKGALIGAICGALISSWISFGSEVMVAAGRVMPQGLDISVAGCPANVTVSKLEVIDESDVFPLYRLTFFWVNPIGVLTTIIVGVIVSFLTGHTKVKKLDADLLSPVIHRFLPAECFPPPATEAGTSRSAHARLQLLEDGAPSSSFR